MREAKPTFVIHRISAEDFEGLQRLQLEVQLTDGIKYRFFDIQYPATNEEGLFYIHYERDAELGKLELKE